MSAEPAAPWLSAEEQRSWRAWLRGSRLVVAAMDEALQPYDLRLSDYEILSMLSESPGGQLRMSTLAHLVVQSRSRVTHTAARLERLGWVQRRPCLDDRRGVEVSLTPQGWEAVRELAAAHVRSVRRSMLDLMSAEEFAALGAAMARVVDGLESPAEGTDGPGDG